MELFVEVYFWIVIVRVVLGLLCLGYSKYPRETSRGTEAISLMTALPFLAWAAYLLWGQ